jgi:hypothetical protein
MFLYENSSLLLQGKILLLHEQKMNEYDNENN